MESKEKEKAQIGLSFVKEAILDYIKNNPNQTNSEIARALGLESDFEGSQSNYLSWSIIGLLVNEGELSYKKVGVSKRYFVKS